MIGGSENFAMKWTILVESSKRGRATRIFVGTFHVSCHLNIYLSFPFREIFLLILLSRERVFRESKLCEELRETCVGKLFDDTIPPAKFRISSRQNQAQTDRLAFNYVEAVPHLPYQLQPLIAKRNRKKNFHRFLYFCKKRKIHLDFGTSMDSKYGRGRLAVGQGSRKAFRLVLHALPRHICIWMLDEWTIFG